MSTVKVQKGGYSVAREAGTTVKTSAPTVKAQKGGYSVAQEDHKPQAAHPTPQAPPTPSQDPILKEAMTNMQETVHISQEINQPSQAAVKLTAAQSRKLNTSALNTKTQANPSLTQNYTPDETRRAATATPTGKISKAVNFVKGAYHAGYDPEGDKAQVQQYDSHKYATKNIVAKGRDIAGAVTAQGDKFIDKAIDAGAKIGKYSPAGLMFQASNTLSPVKLDRDDAKNFAKGATVDTAAGVIQGVSGVPLAGEVAIRDPSRYPKAIMGGLAIAAGSAVRAAKDNPLRTAGAIAGAVITEKVAVRGATIAGDNIRVAGRSKVDVTELAKPEVITRKVNFPTAPRGTPVTSVLDDFRQAKNIYPDSSSLPRTPTGAVSDVGIHVSPGSLPKKGVTIKGSSETPGLYVGPDASLHFAGVDQSTKFKLFGKSSPITEPSINFVQLQEINRLPPSLRSDLTGANQFMQTEAKKGAGYTSVKMEAGLKSGRREKELIIPPDTEFKRVRSDYYTVYRGRKIPVNLYETNLNMGITPRKSIKRGRKSSIADSYRDPAPQALITPESLRLAGVSSARSRSSRYIPKASGSLPKTAGYTPKAVGYIPKASGSLPKTASYTPKTAGYTPKTAGYTPKTAVYASKTEGYTPKGSGYLPKTAGYTPKAAGYTPKGSGYLPKTAGYIPLKPPSKRKKPGKKGKQSKTSWEYSRTHNAFKDVQDVV